MELKKIKWYIVWGTIWLAIGLTAIVWAVWLDENSMTSTWFNAIKTRLDTAYTDWQLCQSNASGAIICNISPSSLWWWWDPIITPNQDPNCESTFTLSNKTLDGVTGYYIQSCNWLKWEANPTIGSSNPAWSSNTAYPEPVWDGTKYLRTRTTISASWYLTWTTILTGHTDYPAFALCVSKWAWWRLPTKRELFSIMTVSKPTWMTYYTALPSITSNYYWSATMYRDSTTYAWNGYFILGTTSIYTKTDTYNRSICIHD